LAIIISLATNVTNVEIIITFQGIIFDGGDHFNICHIDN